MSKKDDLSMFSSSLGKQFSSTKRNTKTYKKEKTKDNEFSSGINNFITSKKNEKEKNVGKKEEVNKGEEMIEKQQYNFLNDDFVDETISVDDIPITQEVELKHHQKSVTALDIDRSGTRLITGSPDSTVLLWDFPIMDRNFAFFREITEAFGNVIINDLKFNKQGTLFVAVPNSNEPRLYERDGACKGAFNVGDPYLSDMNKTQGHTAPTTGVSWHPFQPKLFATCSQDSTIRIWETEEIKKKQKYIIKAKNEKGTKVGITTCEYDQYGRYIAAGCQDGSIQIWNESGPYHVPHLLKRNAHGMDQEITSIKFSQDDHSLISRSMDNTMKFWDIRKFESPLAEYKNLETLFSQTDCLFSPDEKYFLTGTSIKKNTGAGELVFVDKKTLKVAKKQKISNGSAIRIKWHPITNQLFVGSSDYNVHCLYDKSMSNKGILSALAKEKRKRGVEEEQIQPGQIFVPNALPMFQPKMDEKLIEYKTRKDKVKSKIPEKPDTQIGSGFKGQVGISQTQYLLKQLGVTNKFDGTDARDAFLKHAKEAEENPQYVDTAYKKTQPVKYFDVSHLANEEAQEEDIEERFSKKQKKE
eukprot:gene8653-600_t